mmetsp:Transcript_11017/g.33788  ORF Transcript_11017/g.33788 Transcript_11017/m.33788 type:complete len:200 (-) Transcript_11017:197-796(-)
MSGCQTMARGGWRGPSSTSLLAGSVLHPARFSSPCSAEAHWKAACWTSVRRRTLQSLGTAPLHSAFSLESTELRKIKNVSRASGASCLGTVPSNRRLRSARPWRRSQTRGAKAFPRRPSTGFSVRDASLSLGLKMQSRADRTLQLSRGGCRPMRSKSLKMQQRNPVSRLCRTSSRPAELLLPASPAGTVSTEIWGKPHC